MSEEMPENEMSIWDHIAELRNRLLWGIGSLVVTTVGSIIYLTPFILNFLTWPAGGTQQFVAIEPTETIGVYMRVSLLAGFIIALPLILYQIIAFIVPGLYDNEKKMLFTAIPLATLLFMGGVAFTFFAMLPVTLVFFRNFIPEVAAMWRLANYINFITNLMFWIGLSFETPLVVFLLAKFGLVTAGFLFKQWRFALVIIALMAAIITPTVDPGTMAMLMVPLFFIYLLSAFFAAIARPREKVRA
jgi:sec-independent protein translocase protein TatC